MSNNWSNTLIIVIALITCIGNASALLLQLLPQGVTRGGSLVNNYIFLLNLVIYNLITCWKVNKGKIYLEIMNIIANKVINEKDNWLIKKKGINWGIITDII